MKDEEMSYIAKKMREVMAKMFDYSPDRGRTIYLFIYYLN